MQEFSEIKDVILKVIYRNTMLEASDILGKRRHREIVWARQAAIHSYQKHCKTTLKATGQAFNRDHSTVIHVNGEVRKWEEFPNQYVEELILLEKIDIAVQVHRGYGENINAMAYANRDVSSLMSLDLTLLTIDLNQEMIYKKSHPKRKRNPIAIAKEGKKLNFSTEIECTRYLDIPYYFVKKLKRGELVKGWRLVA